MNCQNCLKPTPANAIVPETGNCITCEKNGNKATESAAPSGQAEFAGCEADSREEIRILKSVLKYGDATNTHICLVNRLYDLGLTREDLV